VCPIDALRLSGEIASATLDCIYPRHPCLATWRLSGWQRDDSRRPEQCELLRTESPLITKIPLQLAVSLDRRASRKDDVLNVAEIPYRSKIQPNFARSADHLRGSVKNFKAGSESGRNLALYNDPGKPTVSAGIDPVTAATVSGPRADAFLEPEWEESL